MPDVLQAGTRAPSFFTVGDIDFNPKGFAKDAFVVVGGDFTGVTCMPHHGGERSPIYTDTDQNFVADDRATPDDDLTRDLAHGLSSATFQVGPFFFSVGVITGVWAVVRAPDGETITAQWYIAGEAVGSQVTWDNVDHTTVRLPDISYGIENWIRSDSLTLRVWGGLFHMSTLTLLPRPFDTHLAVDNIDPAATIDSTDSGDALAPSGGDIVVATSTASIGTPERFLQLPAAPADIAEQSLDLLFIARSGGPLTTDTARYKNFAPYVSGDSGSTVKNMYWELWVNGVDVGVQPEWEGGDPRGSAEYTVWSPHLHNQFNGQPAKVASHVYAQTALIIATGDEIEIRIDAFDATSRAFDQIAIGIRIDDMHLVFGAEPAFDEYDPTDTFDIEWEYIGQDTQGGSYVDRTSLFTSVDGLLYDAGGNIILIETGIGTAPWTVDLSLIDDTGTLYAIVRGNLPDGSYAYTGWQFTIVSAVGQIYRRW